MIRVHLICPVVIVLAGCAGLTPGPGVCLAVRIHLVGTVVLTCFVLQTHLRRQIREWQSCKRDVWHSYAHTGSYADWQVLIQQIWHVPQQTQIKSRLRVSKVCQAIAEADLRGIVLPCIAFKQTQRYLPWFGRCTHKSRGNCSQKRRFFVLFRRPTMCKSYLCN